MGPTAFRLCAAALALFACAASAQDFANARLTGHIGGDVHDPFGDGRVDIDFNCTGTPTCSGTMTSAIRDTDCTNTITRTDRIVFTGVDISKPGAFGGQITLGGTEYRTIRDSKGNCTIKPNTFDDKVVVYTGSWDGSAGIINFSAVDPGSGIEQHFSGPFKADVSGSQPPFPMTVRASIDVVTTAEAQIQYRPQDVGTQGSVFVFAMAPASIVKDVVIDKSAPMQWFFRKSPTDLPVQCVLAQLTSSGQLVGVTASTLQAYVSGVLSAQGQAVTIINGVPTVNIGGATFFVGYGTSGTSMLNSGVNRSAVTIPGATVCQPTAPQTGWWWNPLEDGRGFSVEKHGNNLFFASFLYDASGRSTWFVSSGPASLEGSLYVGDLLAASGGQTLDGSYPGFPTLTKVGTATLTFNSATNGTLVWPGGAVPIQRQPFIPNGLSLTPMSNGLESGWWWNESEAGRGFFMEFQGDWLDVAGYMYDASGNSVWYLTVAQMTGAEKRSFSGNWWSFGNGQTLTGAWKPNARTSDHVAPVTITFTGTDSATMTLPNGRTTSLKRHRF